MCPGIAPSKVAASIGLALLSLILPIVLNCFAIPRHDAIWYSGGLEPLSADDIRAAVKILKDSKRIRESALFESVSLAEPDKYHFYSGLPTNRQVRITVFEPDRGTLSEALIDLSSHSLVSFNDVIGAQPYITPNDWMLADRLIRNDPQWIRLMKERGITDLDGVVVRIFPSAYLTGNTRTQSRVVRAVFCDGNLGSNYFAHPIEGVVARVDLSSQQVLEVRDGSANVPVSSANGEFGAQSRDQDHDASAATRGPQAVHDLQYSNGEVCWHNWRFRVIVQPRDGLVLYAVGYKDGERVRPVLYRASLSELLVPYADTSASWTFRSGMDEAEYGIGTNTMPQYRGVDSPNNSLLLDAVMVDLRGEPRTIGGAVAIYERDAGINWRYSNVVRRSTELVVSHIAEIGNYDYGFEWTFGQDGSIKVQVNLAGIVSMKGVIGSSRSIALGEMIAPNLLAVHHQHFFTFRLDFDIDGPSSNKVVEIQNLIVPKSGANAKPARFEMKSTEFNRELDAKRNWTNRGDRFWIVMNTKNHNWVGQPTGFALVPEESASPLLEPGSMIQKRSRFLDYQLWVTPYVADELYAGGRYPDVELIRKDISSWSSANRDIRDRDIVLWYSVGVTHNSHSEEWPVMSKKTVGFQLVPWDFFSRNPASDYPSK